MRKTFIQLLIIQMTEALKKTIERLEMITWLDCIFPEWRLEMWADFIDDMTAHIIHDWFDFCIDMEKETQKELKQARKWLEKILQEAQ